MTEDPIPRPLNHRNLILLLFALLPLLVTTVIWMAGGIQQGTFSDTLLGAGIAALGGVLTGIVGDRFIRHNRSDIELLIGLALATVLGVLTIGYLYLIHIRGPMASIGQLDRAVEQITVFLTYLFTQAVGIRLTRRFIPDPESMTEPAADFQRIESNQS